MIDFVWQIAAGLGVAAVLIGVTYLAEFLIGTMFGMAGAAARKEADEYNAKRDGKL